MSAALSIPPARVIAVWNAVAEDTGTLSMTLLKYAGQLLAEARAAEIPRHDAVGEAISAPGVAQHPPDSEATE